MSAVRRRTANDLLCGSITSPMLEYAVVILVHGVSYHNLNHLPQQDTKISVQVARFNEELPLLTTKTVSISKCIFEEVLVVHTETLEELELLLCTTNEVIDEYDLKLSEREILTYHHFTLVGQSSELFITLVIKANQIPPSVSPKFDIQILVQYLETPLEQPKEAVVLAGRSNYTPDYSQVSFNADDDVQLSTPQGPSDQPQWYHTFLFGGCTLNQILSICLFHHPYIYRNEKWVLGDKIGECKVPLERELVQYLEAHTEGISFTRVPLTAVQPVVFLRLVIKLGVYPPLTHNNIPSTVLEWGSSLAPPPGNTTEQQHPHNYTPVTQPVYNHAQQPVLSNKDDTTEEMLPSHTAILELIERHSTPPYSSQAVQHYNTHVSELGAKSENNVEYMSTIIQQQADQLKQYRDAVQKMGRDVMLCRDHIIKLKADKAELKQLLADLQRPIHNIALINAPKDDLIKEVIRSRTALSELTEQMTTLARTVSQLKHVLNNYKADNVEVTELRHAHTAQNQLLQKLQEKLKVTRVLEKTCRDQEKVIEKLEKLLQAPPHHSPARHITFAPYPEILHTPNPLALLPPDNAIAIPKLEPMLDIAPSVSDSYVNVPKETALKFRVSALETQLKLSQQSHDDEISRLAAQKMDLQLQLALLNR